MRRRLWLPLATLGLVAACEDTELTLPIVPPVFTGFDGGPAPIDAGAPEPTTEAGVLEVDAGPLPVPDTNLTTTPPAKTRELTTSIAFSADLPGATFVCSVDGGAFAPCTSPLSVTVAAGDHTFAVAAVTAGGRDATPATCAWSVDDAPPDTTITSGPADHVPNGNASFSFTSSEAGSSFECALDGGAFAACADPIDYAGLAVGSHTFAVRATDAFGNPDPTPATRTWTVDRQDTEGPPVTVSVLPLVAGRTTASGQVSYASTAANVTWRCRTYLQGAAVPALATCPASPFTLSGFVNGNVVVIDVEGRDAQGDPTLVSRTVTIDAEAPRVTITAPTGRVRGTGTLTFTSPDAGTFACAILDGRGGTVASGACTPAAGLGFAIGTSGGYTARVVATDALGNARTVTQAFTVDATGPSVKLGTCAQQRNGSVACTIEDVAADTARLECRVVGQTNFAACTGDLTQVSFADVLRGDVAFEVRGVDDLGNVGGADARTASVQYVGHAVYIGHDYLEVATDPRILLSNALDNLSYVRTRLGRGIRVQYWCTTNDCSTMEEKNVREILNASAPADVRTMNAPPSAADLDRALADRDVLLVADQKGRQGLIDLGKAWTDAMFTNFVVKGGVLIVLDGLLADGKNPSRTYELLVGPGQLSVRPGGGTTRGLSLLSADAALLENVNTKGYLAPKNTVSVLGADGARWLRPIVLDDVHDVVLHRVY